MLRRNRKAFYALAVAVFVVTAMTVLFFQHGSSSIKSLSPPSEEASLLPLLDNSPIDVKSSKSHRSSLFNRDFVDFDVVEFGHENNDSQAMPAAVEPTSQQDGIRGTVIGYLDADKRNKIVEMIKHAWNGYTNNAWGFNQVHPVSRTPDGNEQIFGSPKFGATIVDSLDTLYLAGLTDEFDRAKNWVRSQFKFEGPFVVSVFEINIRFVGGLLSTYALTKDDFFLQEAKRVATKLLPAFNTPTGIPKSLINLQNGESFNWGWVVAGQCAILAEFGSLSMEFLYLSHVTGDMTYRNKIAQIINHLKFTPKSPDGLYFNYMDPRNGKWCNEQTSVGAMGDSFYEYLFKTWLLTSKHEVDMKSAYDGAMEAIIRVLFRKSLTGHYFFAEKQASSLQYKMDHLACYTGGLFGLSAKHARDEQKYMDVATSIAETCHNFYNSTPTGLSPEAVRFDFGDVAMAGVNPSDKTYLLRPEVVETYFYMWRLTHDPKWRQYGWEVAQAIEKHCRTSGGYSGITDVYQVPVKLDDSQQSFFIAETLKYLYLLFSPDDVLPIDQFVFNTEAHPLPIFKPKWGK